MTNLTEQWKKGELPEETECYVRVSGDIYLGSIRYKNGRHNKKLPYVKSFNGQFITKCVEEVLAEVPSYEQWQELKEYERIVTSYYMKPIDYETACVTVNRLLDEKKGLRQENTKLKKLLKEVLRHDLSLKEVTVLVRKISQVLGEE